MGLTDGVADISQNALLFDAQRVGERSLASRMHAVWSTGALAGTALGTAAAAAGVSVLHQTLGLAALGAAVATIASRPVGRVPAGTGVPADTPGPFVPAGPAGPVSGPRVGGADISSAVAPRSGRRIGAWTLVLGAGVVVAAVEAIANEWSALTLRDGLGASVALAGLGPTAFAAAMLAGRLLGDRAIDRFGDRRVARAGAAVAFGSGFGSRSPRGSRRPRSWSLACSWPASGRRRSSR